MYSQKSWPKPRSKRIQAGEEPGAPTSDVCFPLLFPTQTKALKESQRVTASGVPGVISEHLPVALRLSLYLRSLRLKNHGTSNE